MVGEYTGTSAIVDTAGVSSGEEAGYIRIGCEEYDTGDVAAGTRGADGGWLLGVGGCRVASGLHPDLAARGEIADKRTAGGPYCGGGCGFLVGECEARRGWPYLAPAVGTVASS